jgi:hypothetical protein
MMNRFVLLAAVACATASPVRADSPVRFNRDVRPILSENCYLCHGPDKGRRKAKLRLDDREIALGKKAIVPGKPDESELVRRIFAADADERMPPADTHKSLTAAQKETLKRWIADGAVYEPHWAYIRVERPPVPAQANAIDALVDARLREKNIRRSQLADRRTLLRRLSLDLIGLPPTPDEMRAFLADTQPGAWERQVDRLLQSPHYGERMAVPWLDVVRFADTVGYHGDQNQNIFPYRDYVIDSFNKNKPFDRFTIEQLAGDLLPNPGDEQLIATGFDRLNMVTREGGAQPKEYLAKYAADRVRAVSATWLGSTMGCCECHDHKFDPFWTRDFYSLAAFFADIKQWGVYQDYVYTPNPDLKNWSNDHPFPPERVVGSPYLKRRAERLCDKLLKTAVAVGAQTLPAPEHRKQFDEWKRKAIDESLRKAVEAPGVGDQFGKLTIEVLNGLLKPGMWVTPPPTVLKGGPDASVTPDRAVLFRGLPRKGGTTRIEIPASGWVAAIELELLPRGEHSGRITRGEAKKTTVQLTTAVRKKGEKRETPVPFYHAEADHKEPRYVNGFEVIGVLNGWTTSAEHATQKQTAVWRLDPPQRLDDGDSLILTVRSDAAGCVRLSYSPIVHLMPGHDTAFELVYALLYQCCGSSGEKYIPYDYVISTGQPAEAFAEYKRLVRDLLECRWGLVPTLVTESVPPAVTRVLPRGDWQNETGDIVQPAVPHFLPQPANPNGRRLNRLDLAKWLVARDNPLTARAFVNRLWKQFFGAGLSGVLDDLGAQGEQPTHAELLDWLAAEFMASGWDVKHVVRLIVTSEAYRRDSTARPDLAHVDPTNRLLARQNPRRLEAEFVRDNALAVAGLLDPEIGGPSVFPYQPPGYYLNLNFPVRDYVANTDERQYRRGVYTHWQRTFLHPMLANFDAPSREECWADRAMSNTPQQALTLLNDPSFVEAARVFAESLLKEAASDGARLEKAYERALGRQIKAKERESLLRFLDEQRKYYRANEADAKKLLTVGIRPPAAGLDPAEHSAWASVCRVILNLHEMITRY